jgi:hypothetical protein
MDVRFTPENGHAQRRRGCLQSASNGRTEVREPGNVGAGTNALR